jgi:hypothetical protein
VGGVLVCGGGGGWGSGRGCKGVREWEWDGMGKKLAEVASEWVQQLSLCSVCSQCSQCVEWARERVRERVWRPIRLSGGEHFLLSRNLRPPSWQLLDSNLRLASKGVLSNQHSRPKTPINSQLAMGCSAATDSYNSIAKQCMYIIYHYCCNNDKDNATVHCIVLIDSIYAW